MNLIIFCVIVLKSVCSVTTAPLDSDNEVSTPSMAEIKISPYIRKIYKKISQATQQGDLHTSLKFLRIIRTVHWLEPVTRGKNAVLKRVVCVFVCMCVCVCVCMCVLCVYVCICVCCVCSYVVFVYVCVYVCVCCMCMLCVCCVMCVCVLVLCMYVCEYISVHAYDDLCIV